MRAYTLYLCAGFRGGAVGSGVWRTALYSRYWEGIDWY